MPQTLLTKLREQDGAKAAVVFVHGFGGHPAKTWGNFPKCLEEDKRLAGWDIHTIGYVTRLVPDLVGIWSADAPLVTLALLLKTALTEPPLRDYETLCLIAHSMGGLITQRALIDDPDVARRVSHVFLFGTPSAGLTKAGPFRFLKRQFRDMADNSEFINDLRGRWTTLFSGSRPFRFVAVAGDQDEFVPAVSSIEPFPFDQRAVVSGNHVTIVKPADADNLGVKLVLAGILGDAAPAGPANAARVAVESREFLKTIQMLEPNKDDLDPKAAVDLALALEERDRRPDAIALLEKYAPSDTDAMGVLAGRLKRNWLAGRRRSDAERALSLYRSAFELSKQKDNRSQVFYHAINVAFMELAYRSDHATAEAMAREASAACANCPADFWRTATEADALLMLRESERAVEKYREALTFRPEPRQLKSMCQQAVRLADLLNEENVKQKLTAWWRGAEDAF